MKTLTTSDYKAIAKEIDEDASKFEVIIENENGSSLYAKGKVIELSSYYDKDCDSYGHDVEYELTEVSYYNEDGDEEEVSYDNKMFNEVA